MATEVETGGMCVPGILAGAKTRCFRAMGTKPGIRQKADCAGS